MAGSVVRLLFLQDLSTSYSSLLSRCSDVEYVVLVLHGIQLWFFAGWNVCVLVSLINKEEIKP